MKCQYCRDPATVKRRVFDEVTNTQWYQDLCEYHYMKCEDANE
jgi:hypothetical protein